MNVAVFLCLTSVLTAGERPIDFDSEIVPIFTKSGCNSGACHGAAAGRGGLHLSLLGANPDADFAALVLDYEGRRVNRFRPDQSLLLLKPTGHLEHGGDLVLDSDSLAAGRIREWIRSGAQRTSVTRRLVGLEVTPSRWVSQSLDVPIPLRVVARFEEGPNREERSEDVSEWAQLRATDPASVEIDSHSVATIRRRGQHVVTVRFLDRVIAVELLVPLADESVDLREEPRANMIDDEVLRLLSELNIPPSPIASDAQFLRRVSLDLTGRLPSPEMVLSYLADRSSDKRKQIVENLLATAEFADFWTLRFAQLLNLHSLPDDKAGLAAYSAWLREAIERGTAFDDVARQLLTATGDSHQVGPANFSRMVNDPRSHAELVGRFFLGVRIGCANCHNHPLDKWTQDDYHGLAAIFARLERGPVVKQTSFGSVTNLRTNEPAVPRIPGDRFLADQADPRESLAEWVTSTTNPYFSRAIVNRLWRFMMGRGLVEPSDDLRETNPATHPQLLVQLADDFVRHRFNIRHTLRQIALSNTYARSDLALPGNAHDSQFYSHSFRRPLEPAVLGDAIADVTGVPDQYAGLPVGTRAVSLVDPLTPAPSLDILGRCNRVSNCNEMGVATFGLAAQLHLINGELINGKLQSPSGRLRLLIADGQSSEQIVSDFFLRALGRVPSDNELQAWRLRLQADTAGEREERLEDFVWSLLNSRDFRENH